MKDKKTAPRFVILCEANGTPTTPISEILRVAQNDRCFVKSIYIYIYKRKEGNTFLLIRARKDIHFYFFAYLLFRVQMYILFNVFPFSRIYFFTFTIIYFFARILLHIKKYILLSFSKRKRTYFYTFSLFYTKKFIVNLRVS